MRPKIKFLTAVWGDAYIARFATLALPSFLAPGNLPALAAGGELEVVILTKRSDFEVFDEHPAFRKLRTICPAHFVAIDDLITTAGYGFTLTLAYARAVIACGKEMLDTHFVFMNADFVLADGSLLGLLKQIRAGRSIVLAPSFRATAESIEPKLRAAVDQSSHTLVMPPRELVAMSLAHPHPTTVAKIVNQGLCHSVQPNQLFWQVDRQTLVGRYYLIFMLCLKPERIVTRINSYCDYSFVPEMCPSGNEVVMGDSDQFFMLELQRRGQEAEMLRPGPQSDQNTARSLSTWTTAEHRRAAGHDIVFHAGELPPGVDDARAQASAFIQRIERLLGPPMSHVAHPHWVGGVETFRKLRIKQGLTAAPPELDTTTSIFRARFSWRRVAYGVNAALRSAALAVQGSTLGRVPSVTALHPSWLDYLHLRCTLQSFLSAPKARILVVREHPEYFDSLIGQHEGVRLATPREVLDGLDGELGMYSSVLIYLMGTGAGTLMRRELRLARRVLKQCPHLVDGKSSGWHIFIHQLIIPQFQGRMVDHSFAFELVRCLDAIAEWPFRASVRSFVGGWGKRFNSIVFSTLGGHYMRFGPLSLLWVVPLLVIATPLTLLTNLWSLRRLTTPHYVERWSSVLISIDGGKDSSMANKTAACGEERTQLARPALMDTSPTDA